MMSLFHSNEFEIDGVKFPLKIVGTVEKPWFKADDVCRALGYARTNDALARHVKPIDKTTFNDLIDLNLTPVPAKFSRCYEGQQRYLSKRGFETLVMKCRNVSAVKVTKYLIERYNLDVKLVDHSKEQVHINSVMKAFQHERMETQFRVGRYRIDLYFVDKKIAVECDEYGHLDRSVSDEIERQKYIEDVLSCKFIRFNPDSKKFDIFSVINQIIIAMSSR